MIKRTSRAQDKMRTRGFAGTSLRAGMARDQLIFVIICSAAIGVAVVTMAFTLFSGRSGGRISPSQWQCLNPDCGYEFSKETTERSPIECEKCGGQAVRVNSRKCPECGKKVLVSRMRLTEQGQARYKAMQESSGGRGMLPMGPGMDFPSEIQFWVKQADGSYGWSEWVFAGPAMGSVFKNLTCSECGAPLYGHRRK